MNRLDYLTGAELAVFLGVSPATIRTLARRHGIEPVGKAGRANLYAARAFVLTVGGHDRKIARKRRRVVAQ